MYARGMSVHEIQAFLAESYGTEVLPNFISSVTDEVMAETLAWQSRPLEPMYIAQILALLLGNQFEIERACAAARAKSEAQFSLQSFAASTEEV
jgi:hypothetical protein